MTFTIVQDGNITTPQGYTAGGMHSGVKRKRPDLGYILSKTPAVATAVYTTNAFVAPPLQLTRDSLDKDNTLQAVLVNSGNANSCTGTQGKADALAMQAQFADLLGITPHHIAIASTGVIGVPMPMDKISAGIQEVTKDEHAGADLFQRAILTTDTCQKYLAVECTIDGKTVSIGGCAKGSGMIHPNMATMLGFITTDANISFEHLSALLRQSTDQTFNMISVDGDSSTNDMVIVMANGVAGNDSLSPAHPDWENFASAFAYVCGELAKKIARDGEGATKLFEVTVKGATNLDDARKIGKSIISSNLVKTAIYGNDPNWGRIVCAVGYSKAEVNPDLVSVWIGEHEVVDKGLPLPMDETALKAYLEQENLTITVDLGQGEHTATAWGCDLSYDYVKINASYRT